MKYIHFIRVFAFAVTVALALGGTTHGALAPQVKTPKGSVPAYSATLNDVLVTSVNWKGQDTDSPTANISLKYSSSTIDENTARTKSKTPDDPTIPAGWNRVNNTSTDLTTVPIS